jgi:hypothetical protein
MEMWSSETADIIDVNILNTDSRRTFRTSFSLVDAWKRLTNKPLPPKIYVNMIIRQYPPLPPQWQFMASDRLFVTSMLTPYESQTWRFTTKCVDRSVFSEDKLPLCDVFSAVGVTPTVMHADHALRVFVSAPADRSLAVQTYVCQWLSVSLLWLFMLRPYLA